MISHREKLIAIALSLLMLQVAGCAQLGWRPLENNRNSTAIVLGTTWSESSPVIRTQAVDYKDLARWWEQFGDPVLDGLIFEALGSAPDVHGAQAKLRLSRANRDLAVANLYPTFSTSAEGNRARTGTNAGGSGKMQTTYSAGLDASWEPPIFGGLSDAAAAAKADTAAAAASLDSVRASLAAEVAFNYITLRTNQRRLALARDSVMSQRETLQIAEWRALAGLVTTLDVEQARTGLEQTRASIFSLQRDQIEAENHLAILTGQAPGALRSRLDVVKPMPVAPDTVAVGIPADTLRQRPDIRAAEHTLQAEIARTAQQEAARYPDLSLSGSWGWKALSVASLGSGASVAGALAGSLAAKLFDGGRIRSQIAIQNAVQEQALIKYETTTLTALEDVENALTAYAVGRDRVEARRKAVEAARNANILARTLYESGASDFQKVLETDRTSLTTQDSLALADADVLTAVVRLYKALGGGWQSIPPTTDD